MASFQRASIGDFSLANLFYVGASVSFFTIDAVTGAKTATLATLYSGITGADTLTNPQKLDSQGKLKQPVYVEVPVIGAITPKNSADSHDTGVIHADLNVDAATEAEASADRAESSYALTNELYRRVAVAVRLIPNISAFIATLLDDADAATARATLDAFQDVFTTRGDLLRGGVDGAEERLALGANNSILASDGTDATYRTLTALMDAVLGSTQGQVLYRDAAAWAALAVGTAGQFLQSQGAGANPQWATSSSGLVPIERKSGTADVASLDFTTGLGSTYRHYKLIGWALPATDDVEFWLRTDTAGGASFDATANDYSNAFRAIVPTPTESCVATSTEIKICGAASASNAVSNAAEGGISFEITFNLGSAGRFPVFNYHAGWTCAVDTRIGTQPGSGVRNSAAAINAVRLLFESGNINEYDVTLYGVANA